MYFITDTSPRVCTPAYVTTRMLLCDLQLLHAILKRDDRCATIVQSGHDTKMVAIMLAMAHPKRFKSAIVTEDVLTWRNMILLNTSLVEGVDWMVQGHETFATYPTPTHVPCVTIMTPGSFNGRTSLFFRVIMDSAEDLVKIPGFVPPYAVHTCFLTKDFRALAGNNCAGRVFGTQHMGFADPMTRAVICN
jgi:hypothetical protein